MTTTSLKKDAKYNGFLLLLLGRQLLSIFTGTSTITKTNLLLQPTPALSRRPPSLPELP